MHSKWYFLDTSTGNYTPTGGQKLLCLLSQYLIQCASAMPAEVNVKGLVVGLRDERNLRKIIRRAKALLAAEELFFGEKSLRKRIEGPETHTRLAKTFARDCLRPAEDAVLAMTECFGRFNEFCLENGLDRINGRIFKPLITEVVREFYDSNLRHDLETVLTKLKIRLSAVFPEEF
jgi:hypothetical protein